MSSSDDLDKDSYKALFEYQTKQLDLIKARYAGLENKASKYLTFISLIIAAISIFSKQYLFDNVDKNTLYYIKKQTELLKCTCFVLHTECFTFQLKQAQHSTN